MSVKPSPRDQWLKPAARLDHGTWGWAEGFPLYLHDYHGSRHSLLAEALFLGSGSQTLETWLTLTLPNPSLSPGPVCLVKSYIPGGWGWSGLHLYSQCLSRSPALSGCLGNVYWISTWRVGTVQYVGKSLALESDRHDLNSGSSYMTWSNLLRLSEPLICHL